MGLFPKALLRWKEPKLLRMVDYREAKRSLARMVSLAILAALPLIWLTQRLAPGTTGRLSAALAVVIVFMCFVFWVYRVFPSWVTVTDRGISQSVTSEDEQTWKFKEMRQCEIVTRQVGGKTVRILIIETLQGDRVPLGIADSVSTGDIETILSDNGVKVIRIAEPERPDHTASRRGPVRGQGSRS